MKSGHWTSAEDAILRAGYTGRGGAQRVADQLGRNAKSVCVRAARLGLRTHGRWSADEDRRLINLWGEATIEDIATRLSRTPIGVWERAKKVGLPIGCPAGCEYLSAAAKRCGYSEFGLRSICKQAGVKVSQAMGLARKPTSWTRHVVDSFEVDEAVKARLATETVGEAARRIGMDRKVLVRRLRSVGGLPEKPRRKRHWRIPSAVIEMVAGLGTDGRGVRG